MSTAIPAYSCTVVYSSSGSLSYYESLDHKLDGTMGKTPRMQKPSKQRSPHASFKLPVASEEPQGKSNSAIPVPKLVARPRPKGKQLSLDFEPLGKAPATLSPVVNTHLLKTSSHLSPMETHRPPIASGEAASSKRPLIHARSLDNLLRGDAPVMVELTQNKKAKYSRVVITASTYTLNEELEAEQSQVSFPVHLVTGN